MEHLIPFEVKEQVMYDYQWEWLAIILKVNA